MRQAEALGAISGDSWLSKNRDRLLPSLAVALAASESPLLASLFEREGRLAQEELGSRKRPPPVTVARKFCAEVDALITDLQRTHTSFIRCAPSPGPEHPNLGPDPNPGPNLGPDPNLGPQPTRSLSPASFPQTPP